MSFLLFRVLHFPKYASTTFKISFSLMKEIEEEVNSKTFVQTYRKLDSLVDERIKPKHSDSPHRKYRNQ